MVSFQCNGCGDVLTKPKLDKHQVMCCSSFDCIDCSKRFETPADYKGHTSCISEAEKYQKTSYNGGKQNGPERNHRNQRSRQRGNNRPQWQQRNMNQATGANDTPLGTPVRMSPVCDAPAVEEKCQPITDALKKRKAEVGTTESKDTSEPTKKKKKRKNTEGEPETAEASAIEVKTGTKRKSTLEGTISGRSPWDSGSEPVEYGTTPKEAAEKKKGKKLSKGKEVREDEKEEAKEKKKEKRKRREDPSSGVPSAIYEGEVRQTKKKKSKSKLKVAAADEAADVPALAKSPQPTTLEVAGLGRGDQGEMKRQSNDGSRVAQEDDSSSKAKRKEENKKRKSAWSNGRS